MGPFSFLSNFVHQIPDLGAFFQNSPDVPSTTASQTNPSALSYNVNQMPTAPHLSIPQPPVLAQPNPQDLTSMFQQGFKNFGGNPPIATMSGTLAQAAGQLPKTIDPRMLGVLALMESGGGRSQAGLNNPYGIQGIQNGQQQFINYPNPQTAIMGGPNGPATSQGLLGTILNNPAYSQFRQTGNPMDFFSHWTPNVPGNPTPQQLLMRYNTLKTLFPGLR